MRGLVPFFPTANLRPWETVHKEYKPISMCLKRPHLHPLGLSWSPLQVRLWNWMEKLGVVLEQTVEQQHLQRGESQAYKVPGSEDSYSIFCRSHWCVCVWGFTCVHFHVCKCICMCKCVYVCLETLGIICQVFSILFFEMRFLFGLVLTNQARLAGSGLQGFTCLYLSVVGRKKYTPARPSFYVGPGARTQVLVFAG